MIAAFVNNVAHQDTSGTSSCCISNMPVQYGFTCLQDLIHSALICPARQQAPLL